MAAEAGGLEALEFVEVFKEGAFDAGFVTTEFGIDVGSAEVAGDGRAQVLRLVVEVGEDFSRPWVVEALEVVEHNFGLDAEQAIETPGVGDDAFGEKSFQGVDRSKLKEEASMEPFPFGFAFVGQEDLAGEQAMFEGVAGDEGFTLWGAGSGTF